jgi:hypothetical protein
MEPRPALTHDDRSRLHHFAIEVLDPEPLAVAVAAVLGTRNALLVSHFA